MQSLVNQVRFLKTHLQNISNIWKFVLKTLFQPRTQHSSCGLYVFSPGECKNCQPFGTHQTCQSDNSLFTYSWHSAPREFMTLMNDKNNNNGNNKNKANNKKKNDNTHTHLRAATWVAYRNVREQERRSKCGGREVRKMRGKCWKSVAIAAGRNVWHLSTTLTVFRQFLFSFCTLLLLYFLNEAINLCILFIYQQISRLFPTWFPDLLHALSPSLSLVTLLELFQSVDLA